MSARKAYRLEVVVELTGLDSITIVRSIEQGLVSAEPAEEESWLLLDEDIATLRRIRRLMLDFDMDIDAAGLVLELRRELERRQGGAH